MMLAWSFSARTLDQVARVVRSLGKHRYVREVDHRIHWAVDRALADRSAFAPHAAAFEALRRREGNLELGSRDPRLWRAATGDDVIAALTAFWASDATARAAGERLLAVLAAEGIAPAEHEPFESSPDDPPHPELILLDWELLPVDELDAEHHAGALLALEQSGEEINPSQPIYQEAMILAAPELTRGASDGALEDDFIVWSDGPYPYADYVFRGVAKSARLEDSPVGYRDI